jgi:uncharacterized protein (DUF362 family)
VVGDLLPIEGTIGKQTFNTYKKDSKALVSKVKSNSNLKETILKAVNLIGGFQKIVEKGDEVLLKPNFNSSNPPPASSDPEFVKAVIELLYEHGAAKVVLGESSMQFLSTSRVLEKTGMTEKAKEAAVEIVNFNKEEFAKVHIGGKYLKAASLPKIALKAQKLVYVCCLKTHSRAKFTMSLKLAFGYIKRRERVRFHMRNLEEKIADLNLAVHPNLIIMDARKCFITGGPFSGNLRNPGFVLASGDRVAIDVEGIKIIESFEGSNLTDNPWSYRQIQRAVELELGARNEQDYQVILEP